MSLFNEMQEQVVGQMRESVIPSDIMDFFRVKKFIHLSLIKIFDAYLEYET